MIATFGELKATPLVDDRHGGRKGVDGNLFREHYLGCLWNFNLILRACHAEPKRMWHHQHHGNLYGRHVSDMAENSPSDQMLSGMQCFSMKILGHDFQERTTRFFAGEPHSAPPLEEASWLASLPSDSKEEVLEVCPGMHVTALCMMAEVRFSLAANDAIGRAYLHNSWQLLQHLRTASNGSFSREHYRTTMAMWPIQQACSRARRAKFLARTHRPESTLGVAIVHCSDDLLWLQGLRFPSNTQIWVYLKCSQNEMPSFCQLYQCRNSSHLDRGVAISDECGGYLYHIESHYNDLPMWNLFLQDDAYKHLHLSYLNLVLKSLGKGVVESAAPFFLHLNNDRHLSYWTACIDSVTQALGLPSVSRIATYCCSQFLVHRSLLQARNVTFYKRVVDMMQGRTLENMLGCSYTDANAESSAFRKRPCYVLEFLWHIIFQRPSVLPLREEDEALPAIFRFGLIPSTSLPLPDFSTFLKSHAPA